MYVDSHYDQRKHATFAARQFDWGAWTQAQNDYYGAQQNTNAFQDALKGRQEVTDFAREGRSQDNAYRNAALAQQGSSSRLAASTSRQNAQLAAKTQLKTTKMQIDATYRTFRERLNELEIPTLQLDAWYKAQQVGLAKANLALEARGPRNAFQAATAMRQLDPSGMPASIAAIARNQSANAFEGQSGMPEPLTYDDLAAKYFPGGAGGGGGMGQSQQDQAREDATLGGIRQVAARGPQGQAPGSLESLTDYERGIFQSGIEKLGFDYNDWIQRYQRAGIGNDAGNVRAA